MRLFVLAVALLALLDVANAVEFKQPRIVLCEAGRWFGVSVFYADGIPETTEDSVGLPGILYRIDYETMSSVIDDGKEETVATVVHTYSTYATLSYVYGGVHYTDTLYSDGTVVSQLAKASVRHSPAASLFHKHCRVLR